MLKYLTKLWNSKDLRNKILFTIGMVLVYRLVSQITVPGVNIDSLQTVFEKNQILGLFSMLTGGSAENFSLVLMGLSPYINASIIMQLLTVVVPKLESLSKEGEQGRKQINRYTHLLTVPLAFIQSYGMLLLLNSQSDIPLITDPKDPAIVIPIMITLTTGTMLLVWLGDLITERGISNGISIIIFSGIVAGIPGIIGQILALAQQNTDKLIPFIITLLITIGLTIFIVIVNEGNRKIPITYAGRQMTTKGKQASLPIRINQAGMIPIIFAVSMVTFPTIVAQFLVNAKSEWLASTAQYFIDNFHSTSAPYLIAYAVFIMAFTYFYVSITFNPDNVSENIQKRGGYIPGIRPGKQTADYLRNVSSRMNLFGGLFLAFIAVLPIIIQLVLGNFAFGSVPMIISGAGMIIIVGVVLEIVRQINTQMIMHDYDKLY